MKINSLQISNFRGIRFAKLEDLAGTIVVAGQNGCGKSCVFDAIRLIKSLYGGYSQNEWHQWMGEFQLPQHGGVISLAPMLNDQTKPMEIEARFQLHPDEREFLRVFGEDEVRRALTPRLAHSALHLGQPFLPLMQADAFELKDPNERIAAAVQALQDELSGKELVARIRTDAKGDISVSPCYALSIAFNNYRPGQIGLVDYHGPQRYFQRELVQNLNVNLDAQKHQQSQHALYNYANKYTNVKSELAASYVQEILAEKAGVSLGYRESLTSTLKELFSTFFPHKTFNGPVPNELGLLEFPVITSDGSRHDLNELSAGEKEILYGYLRIRNSAPRFSLILIDEPELHLNPSLIRDLPHFYTKHLGAALDNQIWLITHSDALIREVVGNSDYSLFHMSSAQVADKSESQSKRIHAAEDLEQAVIDLVGDLATYRPGGKVVVFEGGGGTDFDLKLTQRLFPELSGSVNAISGGGKTRVRALHEILERASAASSIPLKIFSVTDRDSDPVDQASPNGFTWDVYHIENYLLDSKFIFLVLMDLEINSIPDEISVKEALRECARATVKPLIRHEMVKQAGEALNSAINLKFNPSTNKISDELSDAIGRTRTKIEEIANIEFSKSILDNKERSIENRFLKDLLNDRWLSSFKGRDILKLFSDKYANSVGYITFRTLIVSRMAEAGHQPHGMKRIVDGILKA